jgi:hypothetical protein
LDVDEDTDLPGRGTSFLEQKIKSKEDFTVLFSYRCCPDCAEYKEVVPYPLQEGPSRTLGSSITRWKASMP